VGQSTKAPIKAEASLHLPGELPFSHRTRTLVNLSEDNGCEAKPGQMRSMSELRSPRSARDARAIRACDKAGFKRTDSTHEEAERDFGPRDYDNSVVLLKRPPDAAA